MKYFLLIVAIMLVSPTPTEAHPHCVPDTIVVTIHSAHRATAKFYKKFCYNDVSKRRRYYA